MKKQNINLEGITQEAVNKQYAAEFGVTTASTISYDLGNGETAEYTQLHLPGGLTAVLHDDADEILLKSGDKDVIALEWSDATVNMLRNLEAMPAAEVLRVVASQAVAK